MVHIKMRLGASFAGAYKETEDADYAGCPLDASRLEAHTAARQPCEKGSRTRAGLLASQDGQHVASAQNCSSPTYATSVGVWQFGDTLTFAVRPWELARGGMALQLRVQSGVRLGPLQLDMPCSANDFGEAVVDLRRRVLPVCVPSWTPLSTQSWAPASVLPGDPDDWKPGAADIELEHPPTWESPALVVPLSRVVTSPHSGVEVVVVARVAVSFIMNNNPAVLLKEMEEAEKPFANRLADHVAACLRAPLLPLTLCSGQARAKAAESAAEHGAGGMTWVAQRHQCPRNVDVLEEEPDEEAAPYIDAPVATDWAFKL